MAYKIQTKKNETHFNFFQEDIINLLDMEEYLEIISELYQKKVWKKKQFHPWSKNATNSQNIYKEIQDIFEIYKKNFITKGFLFVLEQWYRISNMPLPLQEYFMDKIFKENSYYTHDYFLSAYFLFPWLEALDNSL